MIVTAREVYDKLVKEAHACAVLRMKIECAE